MEIDSEKASCWKFNMVGVKPALGQLSISVLPGKKRITNKNVRIGFEAESSEVFGR
jgi:hypothetical protein